MENNKGTISVWNEYSFLPLRSAHRDKYSEQKTFFRLTDKWRMNLANNH